MTNVLAFLNFARAVRKHFGAETAMFLRWPIFSVKMFVAGIAKSYTSNIFRIIVASQFHMLFYASRPLPNSFAFILVILSGRLPLFGWDGALLIGARTAVQCIAALTIPIDSLFWGRPIYPEFEVAVFNLIKNKSHEYGVSPFLWYFYSCLPRALAASLPLAVLGVFLDRRLRKYISIALIFILSYSLLPHKELRFIIYSFPLINLSAAVFCARMYINRHKSFARQALYYGCCLHLIANLLATAAFLYAGARNYPGGDAIAHLQWTQRMDANKPMSVYIDNACAQTGVSRFMQLYGAWEYTENLRPKDLERFDFLMIGTYSGNLKDIVMTNYSTHHRVMFAIPAFHRFTLKKSSSFPFYHPEMVFKEKVAVLRKK
ncbi:unnamed protein product [Cylicostephanus goldi]|uniref:Mannosyltransferase n=1 Tax=Cylicostephanus goldi TaxID=71465 RepID=A0A3P7LS54_CYLGO|nr:unnamed protein product [Cylicostephanus goldi]